MSGTPPRRPFAVRVAPGAVVALLLLGLLGWVGAPGASAQADDGPTLTLVQQTAWVGPDGTFQVVVRPDGLPAGATVRAELYARIRSRAALADAVDDDDVGSRIFVSTARPATELDPAGDGTVVVRLPVSTGAPTEPGGVQLDRTPGIYPFVVQFYDADGAPIAHLTTTLLRLGEPASPDASTNRMSVGVVVPLEGAVVPGDDGVPVLDADAAADLVATTGVVTGHPEVPLTLAPSPQSLELLAAEATSGTTAVTSLQTRVARQVLTTTYAPLDTGAWIAAGLSDELTDQHRAGTAALTTLLASQPDASTALLDPTVTPEALAALAGLGVTSVVVPSGQLDPLSDRTDDAFAEQFDVPTPGGTVRGVVGDDTTALRLALTTDPVLAGHRALAELALIHLSDPSAARGVAVTVPPSTDPTALGTFLDGLADIRGAGSGSEGEAMVSPVTLTDLFATTETAETTRNGRTSTLERSYGSEPPADLGTYPTDLRAARQSLRGLQSLVPQSPELVAPVATTLLGSGTRTFGAAERDAVLAAAAAQTGAVAGQIVVPTDQVVTLTSSSGKIPLNIENRLQVPARVRIVLRSAKLDFPEGSVIEQDLAPAQTTAIALPVETRASGAFPLDVTITSADATLPVAATTYTVRSTAISGVGLVLSVGAGLFLLVWWARHWRTSRRARKLIGSSHPALSAEEPGGYAPPDRSSGDGAGGADQAGTDAVVTTVDTTVDTGPATAAPEPTSLDPLEGR